MSGTLLEQTRAFHEETERLERCIVQELQKETKSHKERLHQNHRVNNMRHAILDATGNLAVDLFGVICPKPLLSSDCISFSVHFRC
jgi:splicing factor 3A subunit 3